MNVCDKAPTPGATHHWVPRRDGVNAQREPVYVQTCMYCGRTEKDVRDAAAIAATLGHRSTFTADNY